MIESYMKYSSEDVTVVGSVYMNNFTPALHFVDDNGMPIATATRNIDGVTFDGEYNTLIKDDDENQGVLLTLLTANIVVLTGQLIETDDLRSKWFEVTIIDQDIIKQIDDAHERLENE
jgi:hypothetical protein